MDCVTLIGILIFYGILGHFIYSILPEGKISKLWHYKFVLKKYSTLASALLCFAPAFLLSAVLNFEMQS